MSDVPDGMRLYKCVSCIRCINITKCKHRYDLNIFKSAWFLAIEWAIAHRCRMSAEGAMVVGTFLRTLALTSFLCVWLSDFQFCSTALPGGASVFIVRRHSLPKSTAWKRSVGLNLALVRGNAWRGSIRSSQAFAHLEWSSHKEDERE